MGPWSHSYPRCVKVQNIKGIANIIADSVSRLRAVGHYHDFDSKDNLQELGTWFEPLPPIEQSTHTPTEVHKICIKSDIENLTQNYNTHNNLLALQSEESRLSIDNASAEDLPRLKQKLMSFPELLPEKILTFQKNDTFCNKNLHHIHCNTNKNYFKDALCNLNKKVIDFNSTYLSVVVPKILIKYLLHASHESLGHIGATKLYHFLERFYYFQGMWKMITQKC